MHKLLKPEVSKKNIICGGAGGCLPRVMYRFLGMSYATALVDNSCTMWTRRVKKFKNLEFERLEGSKRKNV
jgi:hypothetical protein